MNVVVLGASRGIGRAVARRLAQRGDRLFLLGRDLADLALCATDLSIRANHGGEIGTAMCDMTAPETFAPALAAATQTLGHVDCVVVTAADFATQAELEADLAKTRRLLDINFTNTIIFCETARTSVLAKGGTLCVASSVAGDRGRKPVILYGASKAGLSYYLEGLDHKFRAQGLRVVCIKPGFVKTGMTSGLTPPPFAGEADDVAADIVGGIDRGTPVVYTPRIWQFVMLVIKLLPRFVMRRIGF
ncbi:MAG: SDR family NAD(P)-dependent oxidoreductase [Vicinamibacterales bacterium]